MENNSFILLSRSILDSKVFASEKMLKIWLWCLCRANFKDRNIPVKVGRGDSIVDVKRGQFLFGRFSAEEDLLINGNTIYKILKKLEQMGNIELNSNNHYTVITICNYDYYQSNEAYAVTAKVKQSNSKSKAKVKASNTDNKDNNANKGNKEKKNKYAEFVFLTQTEYNELCKRYTEYNAQRCIETLDNYKGSKGKTYKSDYRAILSWVVDKLDLKEREFVA